MADVARQPRPDLNGQATDPLATGFFELLRRLETETQRFGRSGGPADEPARLGQRVRLAVATREIAGFRPGDDLHPTEIDVEVLGLLGPEGAMPLHMTRWVMERLSEKWFAGDGDRATLDTAFLDFCNMLQHRHLSLYWRAWGDARAEVQVELGSGGRARAIVDMLAGLGLPGVERGGFERDGADAALLRRHGTSLASAVHGAERLVRLVGDLLQAPVRLLEFVGQWIDVPVALQTRLGSRYGELGKTAVAGARVFERQSKAELQVGPLSLPAYRILAEDAALKDRLGRMIRFCVGREVDFDLRLILSAPEIPEPALGAAQIGLTTWLSPKRTADAADLRFYAVTQSVAAGAS